MGFIIDSYKFVAGETSNSNTDVRKSSGTDNAWNAGFESTETIPSSTTCYVKFTAKDTDFAASNGNYVMVGFSRSGDTVSEGFTSIRYAAYLRYTGTGSSHTMRVFELGTQKYSETSVTDGDVLEVYRDGGTGAITYRLNGVTQYTSASTDTGEFKVDGSFFGLNDRALNITLNRGDGDFNPFYSNKVNVTEY